MTTTLLSPQAAAVHLLIFAALMVAVTVIFSHGVGTKSLEEFLVVDRQVPWWIGGPSITASWTWAVALLISVQMAYQQGIAGIFWFTVPNVIAVLVFLWLGPQIRKRFPKGYSLPEWIQYRLGNKAVTGIFMLVFIYYQVIAVVVQVYAGAHLLSAATGISPVALMPTVLVITWIYALIAGMEASVITDFLQTALMLIPGWIIVSLVIKAAHGQMYFSGVLPTGGLNPFNPKIALTAGVITSIGLLSGSIGDQAFWQRCFTIKEKDLKKSFIFGAFLFASIPISLSLLGFTAAAPGVGLHLPPGFDGALVGFAIVKHLLPPAIAIFYLYIVLAGLCSTLDSALSAASSLYPQLRGEPAGTEKKKVTIGQARVVMIILGLIGLGIGYAIEFIPGFGLKYLWWFLNAMGASIVVPIVLSLFWDRLTAQGVLWGSGFSILIGLPLIIYGSIAQKDYLLAATYAGILAVSTVICLATGKKDFSQEPLTSVER